MTSAFDRSVCERIAAWEADGLLRTLAVVEGETPKVRLPDGRVVVSFCSNDYLGLCRHPALVRAAQDAAARHGVGSGGSRLVCGTQPLHREAEAALSSFVQQPAALLCGSAYAASLGALPALFGPGDLLVSDALNHASLVDACRASRATVAVVPHGDVGAVRDALRRERGRHRLAGIVTETLFSMDGDHPDLAALAALAAEYDAACVVDEAHAVGVVGPRGAGLAAQLGIRPDILVAGLGKALGSAGGLVAAQAATVRWLENRARTFVFSTAVPPAAAAVAAACVPLAAGADDARVRLRRSSVRLRGHLREAGLDVPAGESPIVPLILGKASRAVDVSARLLGAGFFLQAIRPPSVPDGTSRLRIAVTAAHTDADVDGLAAAIARAL